MDGVVSCVCCMCAAVRLYLEDRGGLLLCACLCVVYFISRCSLRRITSSLTHTHTHTHTYTGDVVVPAEAAEEKAKVKERVERKAVLA